MDVDTLHSLVSSAIWRAEQLDDLGVTSTATWAEVSSLEEQLAAVLPVSEPEGKIARRGAVRAALEAKEYERAQRLTERYSAEAGVAKSLREALRKMLADDTRALATRFRYAVRRLPVEEARSLARRLRAGGAFGLAA